MLSKGGSSRIDGHHQVIRISFIGQDRLKSGFKGGLSSKQKAARKNKFTITEQK